jgi:hypothetical protein
MSSKFEERTYTDCNARSGGDKPEAVDIVSGFISALCSPTDLHESGNGDRQFRHGKFAAYKCGNRQRLCTHDAHASFTYILDPSLNFFALERGNSKTGWQTSRTNFDHLRKACVQPSLLFDGPFHGPAILPHCYDSVYSSIGLVQSGYAKRHSDLSLERACQ